MRIANFLEERQCRYKRVSHRPTYSAQRMAQELQVPGREVAKTVLLRANSGYRYVVAVLPANKMLDLAKASNVLGGAVLELASESELAERYPDCELGALPPFGSRYGMQTIVDASLAEDEEIVFEGNTHDEAIRMSFEEFRRLEEPYIAPIAQSEKRA